MSLPIFLKIEGRKCVVIGGGRVATRKVESLRAGSAEVHVVSPTITQQLGAIPGVHYHRRCYGPEVLDGAVLVFVCTDDAELNARIYRDCQARRIWCNVVNVPAECDFFMPAVVRQGSFQIAISTGGASPQLAANVRRQLARQFGPLYDRLTRELGRARRIVLRDVPAEATRRAIFRTLCTDESIRLLAEQGARAWRKWAAQVIRRHHPESRRSDNQPFGPDPETISS